MKHRNLTVEINLLLSQSNSTRIRNSGHNKLYDLHLATNLEPGDERSGLIVDLGGHLLAHVLLRYLHKYRHNYNTYHFP